MFMQTPCNDFGWGHLVPINLIEHKLIYDNLLHFEKTDTKIEIYLLFHDSPKGDPLRRRGQNFATLSSSSPSTSS